MAFRLSRAQLTERDALPAELRRQAQALNSAIAAFNQAVAPLSQAVRSALDDYNGALERARTLAGSVAETAQDAFDAKSERWQSGDTGIAVRSWIEQWEMSLDDVELELPEPLTEIDPDEHAGALEGAAADPTG